MKKETLRKTDLVFSIFLMILSIVILFKSYQLLFNPFGRANYVPSPEEREAILKLWYESPALFPAIIAGFLLLCSIFLLKNAIKEGAKFDFFTKEKLIAFISNHETKVAAIIIAILSTYIFILIPICRTYLDFFPRFQGFPFMIATFITLSAQMIIFSNKRGKKILIPIMVSAISSVVITLGFGIVAMIPLP